MPSSQCLLACSLDENLFLLDSSFGIVVPSASAVRNLYDVMCSFNLFHGEFGSCRRMRMLSEVCLRCEVCTVYHTVYVCVCIHREFLLLSCTYGKLGNVRIVYCIVQQYFKLRTSSDKLIPIFLVLYVTRGERQVVS